MTGFTLDNYEIDLNYQPRFRNGQGYLFAFDKKHGRIQDVVIYNPESAYAKVDKEGFEKVDHYWTVVVNTPEEYWDFIRKDKELYERECQENPEMLNKPYVLRKREPQKYWLEEILKGWTITKVALELFFFLLVAIPFLWLVWQM